MTKITVDREALDRWREALKSLDPYIQQLAVNALRDTAAQPKQQAEPVAMLFGTLPVFDTPPPQRPWQGLEAEDLAQIESDEFWQTGNHMAIAMAVEAKLRSKNDH